MQGFYQHSHEKPTIQLPSDLFKLKIYHRKLKILALQFSLKTIICRTGIFNPTTQQMEDVCFTFKTWTHKNQKIVLKSFLTQQHKDNGCPSFKAFTQGFPIKLSLLKVQSIFTPLAANSPLNNFYSQWA